MDKRQLHHWLVRLRPLSYRYFLILTLIFGLMTVFALRNNNLTAIELRDRVIAVDEQNGDVEGALRDLRQYVYSHMRTDLSHEGGIQQPVQLKYRYERLVRAEKERVSKVNEKVYTDAQTVCEQQIPTGRIASRVPCVQDYVSKNTIKEQTIPDSLYKFDFQPPIWSPDLAGISLVLALVCGLVTIISFGFERWVRHRLRQHF